MAQDSMASLGGPPVTIVVCAYNAERYLVRALDSLLAQTYPRISILVIDDGSTDATPRIIREYARQNPGLTAICSPENRGTAAVRQQGLELAQTELMLFFDADDIALPDLVTRQVAMIRADEKCIAVGVYAYYIGADDEKKRLALQAIGATTRAEFFRRFHEKKVFYTLPYTLFRKSFAVAAGGFRQTGFEEDPDLRLQDISEDVDLWTRMADFGRDGCYMLTIPEGLVLYRKMAGTLSAVNVRHMARKLRWIKDCVQRRRSGLAERRFFEFLAQRSWWQRFSDWRQDLGGYAYKRMTLAVLGKQYLAAVLWGMAVVLFSPGLVLKKLQTQRLWLGKALRAKETAGGFNS